MEVAAAEHTLWHLAGPPPVPLSDEERARVDAMTDEEFAAWLAEGVVSAPHA